MPKSKTVSELTKRIRARQTEQCTDDPFVVQCPALQSSDLVTFEQPSPGMKRWFCIIGGVEFSRESRQECVTHAIELLAKEIERLTRA
jgi:hypothetical protein